MKTSLITIALIAINCISVLVPQQPQPTEDPEDLGIPNDWIEEIQMNPKEEMKGKKGSQPKVPKQEAPGDPSIPKDLAYEEPESLDEEVEKHPKKDLLDPEPNHAWPEQPIEPGPRKLVNLCDDPVVVSAINRFSNFTIRLYRDNNYWDLMGLPDRQAFTTAKDTISIENMSPVTQHTPIVTVLEGANKDLTYKFEDQFFWSWDENGTQVSGGKGGEHWLELPKGGFSAMFHNGNSTKPMFIAFKDDKAYYLSTQQTELEFVGDSAGHKGGKYGERFPPNITAAFIWPMADKVMLYLFRDDKYCFREFKAPESGKDCDEWLDTKELFGCQKVAVHFGKTDQNTTTQVTNTTTADGDSPTSKSPTTSMTPTIPGGEGGVVTFSSTQSTGVRQFNHVFHSTFINTSIGFTILLILNSFLY